MEDKNIRHYEWIRADPIANGVVVVAVAGKVTLGGAQPYSR